MDTRPWSWRKWCKHFIGIILYIYQVTVLQQMDRGLTSIQIARQHGKSSIIVLAFCVRKLCETVFWAQEGKDRPILYVSASRINVFKMMISIRFHLMANPLIVNYYGKLVNREKVDGLALTKNTINEIRLYTLQDTFLISMYGTTTQSGLRGGNFFHVIIDDGVDYKEAKENPSKAAKATRDLESWHSLKVTPLSKGTTCLMGTRYGLDDIYARYRKKGIYEDISYPAIIGGQMPEYIIPERVMLETGKLSTLTPKDIVVIEGQDIELLAPELWDHQPDNLVYNGTPIQNLLFKILEADVESFRQEYLNDPIAYSSVLNMENFLYIDYYPNAFQNDWQFILFIDPAAGKSLTSNITSMVFMLSPKDQNLFYIHDIIKGRWTGAEKQKQAEDFFDKMINTLSLTPSKIHLKTEVVRAGGKDFYHRLLYESKLRPHEANPAGRGEKEERIIHGLGHDMEKGLVFIHKGCRNISALTDEIQGFPKSVHPDITDNIDQCIDYLRIKQKKSTIEAF